jgi:hypothetical protein
VIPISHVTLEERVFKGRTARITSTLEHGLCGREGDLSRLLKRSRGWYVRLTKLTASHQLRANRGTLGRGHAFFIIIRLMSFFFDTASLLLLFVLLFFREIPEWSGPVSRRDTARRACVYHSTILS